VFGDAGDGLMNQWFGGRAVRASVGYGASWLDGGPSLVMDYAATSRVWRNFRDEVREVALGVYLGRTYRWRPCGPDFQQFFALEACPTAPADR
jgi:hypothetical protein